MFGKLIRPVKINHSCQNTRWFIIIKSKQPKFNNISNHEETFLTCHQSKSIQVSRGKTAPFTEGLRWGSVPTASHRNTGNLGVNVSRQLTLFVNYIQRIHWHQSGTCLQPPQHSAWLNSERLNRSLKWSATFTTPACSTE